jgi:hypothetical protein
VKLALEQSEGEHSFDQRHVATLLPRSIPDNVRRRLGDLLWSTLQWVPRRDVGQSWSRAAQAASADDRSDWGPTKRWLAAATAAGLIGGT